MNKIQYADTCDIHNTDRDVTVVGEILDFRPDNRLVVSLGRSVKVSLEYDSYHKIYVGSMAGMEFTSKGPKEL